MSQHVDGDDEHKLLDSLGIPSAEPDGMGGSVFLSLESRIKLLAQQLAEARAKADTMRADLAAAGIGMPPLSSLERTELDELRKEVAEVDADWMNALANETGKSLVLLHCDTTSRSRLAAEILAHVRAERAAEAQKWNHDDSGFKRDPKEVMPPAPETTQLREPATGATSAQADSCSEPLPEPASAGVAQE